MESSQNPLEFNPWTQNATIIFQDGAKHNVSMDYINFYRLYITRSAINYSSQVGASFILLLVLLLLTRVEKRKSFIFIINTLCLTANTIRCVLLCCYITGSLWHPYSAVAGDWSRVTTSDLGTIVAANVFTLLVITLIMISLSVQVWVVCVNTLPVHRYIIMAVTLSVACIALGYKAAFVIYSIFQTLAFEDMEAHQDLVSTSYVMQAVSIWLFSCAFIYKLGHAIIERRRLNMPQFGPMQVVFIMGCQTMLIPAIFSTLQFVEGVPEFGTQVLTVVSIFLPLSAIWAGVANESNMAGNGPHSHQRLIHAEFYRTSSNTTSTANTACNHSRGTSGCTYTKGRDLEATSSTASPGKKTAVDDDGILIGHEFGFSHSEVSERV